MKKKEKGRCVLREMSDFIPLLGRLEEEIKNFSRWATPGQLSFGGYLAVWERSPRVPDVEWAKRAPLIVVRVGTVPPEKTMRYFALCQEKATRLLSLTEEGHVSSWQSREPDQGRYGGAIVTSDFVFGFSGLTEEGDEGVLVRACFDVGMLSLDSVQTIASTSCNPFLRDFHVSFTGSQELLEF